MPALFTTMSGQEGRRDLIWETDAHIKVTSNLLICERDANTHFCGRLCHRLGGRDVHGHGNVPIAIKALDKGKRASRSASIARGTLRGLLLLLLFCCWKSPRLTLRVTWRLKVHAAVIGSIPMSPRSPEGVEKPRAPLQTMLPK
jgi:hypothetical protein